MFTPLIDKLIISLQYLPGIGVKSARRMALYLLERERDGGLQLANAIKEALTFVKKCSRCRTLAEKELCQLCSNPNRNKNFLCIVESPIDLISIEQTGKFNGYYFVLSGHLSPISGIGPQELGMDKLFNILQEGHIKEVILATNPTVEGEATAYFLIEKIKAMNINVFRLANGVPVGGELEYVDSSTLAYAMEGKQRC